MKLPNAYHMAVLAAKRAFYGDRGEPFRVGGHSLRYAPGTRPVRLHNIASRNSVVRYDALQLTHIAATLKEGDVAIDVGAHAGQNAIAMAALCGATGTVVAFEPDPHARRKLEYNLSLNSSLKHPVIEALALSEKPGKAVLYSFAGNANSSMARSGLGGPSGQAPEQIHVHLACLDDYIAEHALSAPRLVKIDTEGAEVAVLKGAQNLMLGTADILCELHPYAWPEFGTSLEELKAITARAGRRLRYLDQDHEMSGEAVYGTVLLETNR